VPNIPGTGINLSVGDWTSLASAGLKPGPPPHAPGASGASSVSDVNTTVGPTSRGQAGYERRVAWLEEDVAVLHRRLRDEVHDGSTVVGAGASGLRALVARLDGELAAERHAREGLEVRLRDLEKAIVQERKDREALLRGFSAELESTMRTLIARIDDGISAGAAAMRERTDQTELRLRTLIKRVDEGLSAGAAALQDTLNDANGLASPVGTSTRGRVQQETGDSGPPRWPPQSFTAEQGHVPGSSFTVDAAHADMRAQVRANQALSPSSSFPCTMQVPGSGLNRRVGSAVLPAPAAPASGYLHTAAGTAPPAPQLTLNGGSVGGTRGF